jgi:hypothetical protein
MEPMGMATPMIAFGSLTALVKRQYEVRKNPDGSIIYVFTGFPTHYACPSCFVKDTLQVLQFRRVGSGYFACPSCKTFFPVTSAPRRAHDNDGP